MTHGKTPLLPSLSEATYVKRAYARCIFESQGNSQLQSDKYNSRQLPTAIPTGNISLSLSLARSLFDVFSPSTHSLYLGINLAYSKKRSNNGKFWNG